MRRYKKLQETSSLQKRKKTKFLPHWLWLSFFAVFLFWLLIRSLPNLACFKVKEIYLREDQGKWKTVDKALEEKEGLLVQSLWNKNIFTLDLEKESMLLARRFPEYKRVRLVRVFPQRIFIDCQRRRPVARIRLLSDYFLDEELYLFASTKKEAIASPLPLILGLSKKLNTAIPGKRYVLPELSSAIELINHFNSKKELSGFEIEKINLAYSDYLILEIRLKDTNGDVSISLDKETPNDNSFEVRISASEIKSKTNLLASLLAQFKDKLFNLEYIDLRFSEPVIKFRNGK